MARYDAVAAFVEGECAQALARVRETEDLTDTDRVQLEEAVWRWAARRS